MACGGEGTEPPPPLSLPDSGAELDGRVPGTPYLGCQSVGECSSVGRADCVPISDGFRACSLELPAPATEPSLREDDQSCDSARPCETGTCYALTIWPGGAGQCGGGGADVYNRCLSDECSSDADCPDGGFCAPRGVAGRLHHPRFPMRHCIAASCRANADCTDRPGGVCGLVGDDCRSNRFFGYSPPQLACVYPDGCTHQDNCPPGHECTVVGRVAACVPGP